MSFRLRGNVSRRSRRRSSCLFLGLISGPKGMTYLQGLLLDGQRKSMQPMAQRLGIDHQGLQQFVTTSI
jgi:hypothetical protein